MAAIMKTATATGSVASFWSPKPAAIKSLKVYFEPKQTGDGDPSPDNPRPIVGWNGIETWKTGKNVCHIVGYAASNTSSPTTNRSLANNYGTTLNTIDFQPPDSSVIITQSSTSRPDNVYTYQNGYVVVIDDNLKTNKDIHYYNISFRVTDIISNPLNVSLSDIRISTLTGNIRASTEIVGDRIIFKNVPWKRYENAPNRHGIEIRNCGMSFTLSEFMVTEATENDQTYEPYIGNKITTSWESEVGTIYGGYVDLISGELVQTYGYRKIVGDENWQIYNGGSGTNMAPKRPTLLQLQPSDGKYHAVISDKLAGEAIWSPQLYHAVLNNGGHFLFGAPEELSTKEIVNEWIQEIGGFDVVYPLVNPITYQLTSQQISSFIGRNNLFSNASNIEVEYEYADSPELEVIKKRIALNEPHLSNASGSIANFYTDMASPMKSLRVNFEAEQSGTGDPSPDNMRPITGVDQINVYRTGKNLCHIIGYSAKTHSTPLANRATQNNYGTSISTINYTSPDTPLVITQSSYDESTAPNYYNNGFFSVMFDSLTFGKTYNVSFKITDILSNPLNVNPSIINIGTPSGYEQRPTEIQGDKIIYKNVKYDKSKSHDAQYFFVRCCGMSYTMSEFMVTEATEEDQTFEPFQGNIIPCSFSELGTQYGGYVDLVKGELTATHYHLDINTTSIPSMKIDGIYNNYIVIQFGVTENNLPQFVENTQISNRFSKSLPSGTPGRIATTSKYIYMIIPKDDLTGSDIAAIREWFANNPTEVVYELKTPITYQLTSQQIKTFRGTNNVYSFDGTVDVKYWLHSDVKTEP